MTDRIRILHVEDDPDFAALTHDVLSMHGEFAISHVIDPTDGLAHLASADVDCIVSDYDLPSMHGVAFLEEVRERDADIPFILFTGKGSEEIASEAISSGVTDYLQKVTGTDQFELLANRIEHAAEQSRIQQQLVSRTTQLEQLHAATRRLMQADTREEVADITTQTTQDILDLPTNGVWLYDDAADALLPISISNVAKDVLEDVPSFARGEGLAWETYATGEVQYYDDVSQEPGRSNTDTTIRSECIVPLGDHGVLLAGSTTAGDFDDGDVTSAQLLAANVEEALDRAAREETMREKERRYQATFNDPHILVTLLDTDGTILSVNDTAMGYIAGTRETVVGAALPETPWFGHAYSVQERMRALIDQAAGGKYLEFSTDIVDAAGDFVAIEGMFRPVRDRDGNIISLLVSGRDVSEQQTAERQLRNTHERYQRILEHQSDVILIVDPSGTIEFVSPAIEKITGEAPDAVMGTDVVSHVHPDHRNRAADAIEAAQSTDEVSVELKLAMADGSYRWVEARGGDYLDDPLIDGILINVRDIHDRKQDERMLERQQAFLEKSAHITIVLEADGTIDFVSPAVETILGLDPAALIGTNGFDLMHPDDQSVASASFAQLVEEAGQEVRTEARFQRDDGEWVWLEINAYNQLDVDPINGILINARDIADRKAYENELKDQYRNLFDLAPVMATVTGREDDWLVIEDCNARFEERMGYDRSELIDRNLIEFFTPESARARARAREQGDTGPGDIVEGERTLVTKDGEQIETIVRAIPRRGPDGEAGRALGFFIDVSKRRSLERENERLEEFTSLVSHDLRNPLNVANSRVELAMEECASRHLDQVMEAHDRMALLIDDLLTLAQSGQTVTEVAACDLASMTENAWATVETGDAEIVCTSSQTVRADPHRLQQVFENVLRNAIDHVGRDVTVTVEGLADGFAIADDGPGIPSDVREDVFSAGYTTVAEGTGLGLRIVKQIADAHEWTVTVTESERGGARVVFRDVDVV